MRILRLDVALAIEDAGAVRFVNILEAAERIARVWRKSGGSGVEEVHESSTDGLNDPAPLAPPTFRFASHDGGNNSDSPNSSTDRLSINSSGTMKRRLRSASSMSLPKAKAPKLPPVDPSQRPFDCLLNFLPARTSDKATLKQMILVTTISRPFLTSASNPAGPRPNISRSSSGLSISGGDGGSKRWSGLLQRQSGRSAPTTPNSNRSRTSLFSGSGSSLLGFPPMPLIPRRAHLVHLIAPTAPSISRSKLMQSIESFLCSFAYPTVGDMGMAGQPDAAGMERAAPFLMHPYTLKAVVKMTPGVADGHEGQWSIAELLLSGSLDRVNGASETPTGTGIGASLRAPPPRAWLSSSNDIMFVPGSRPVSQHSITLPAPPLLAPLPPSPHRGRAQNSFLRTSELGTVDAHTATASSTWSHPTQGAPRMPMVSLNSFSGKGKERERERDGAFRMPSRSHFRSSTAPGEGSLPTPPDSEESDSSGSGSVTDVAPSEASKAPLSVKAASSVATERERKTKSIFGGGSLSRKGMGVRWKFWKTTPTAVAV